ncbi:uncharacterized protein [Rutidosis leptorrhynchoides]|uniref:uncharacterized protein n=1 Tax=Rutidosis leptorrhynchoides TaxID=125765 RepID=UPI003A9A3BE8
MYQDHEIMRSSHEEEEDPLFLNFPSPFFDKIATIPILENKHTHQQQKQPLTISEPSPLLPETKRVNKKSRERHSKIYTAQGFRGRRMRLSLHIARKFFDLQDLLGFDKASKTIEWLFCKSNKAIKEVTQNFNPEQTNYPSSSEEIKDEIKVATNKLPNNSESRKQIRNNYLIKETRDQARARARDRTKKRLMNKELEKSNQCFRGNPKDEFQKLGLLGYLVSPNNQNILEELGYINSPSDQPLQQQSSTSSSSSFSFKQYSSTNHLLQDHLQSAIIDANSFGEWDTNSFITDYFNYGVMQPNIGGHMTAGGIYEQDPSSLFMSTTNISQNQGK